jgi:hypothetical protein
LLELFPNAKFIYIHRDPYDTISSTIRFFKGVLPAQQHQVIDDAELEKNLVEVFKRLHGSYTEQKKHIPEGNLVEIGFNDFVENPVDTCQTLMSQFGIESSISDETRDKYHKGEHRIKSYSYPDELINLVNNELKDFINDYNYPLLTSNS